MQYLEHVLALVTPIHVVLRMKTAKLQMVIVSVAQIAIFTVIVAKMSTVLHVIQYIVYYNCFYKLSFNTDPRMCADVGITSCCTDTTGAGLCDVHYRDAQNNHCSCNITCHLRNDCCSDAVEFCIRKLLCMLIILVCKQQT